MYEPYTTVNNETYKNTLDHLARGDEEESSWRSGYPFSGGPVPFGAILQASGGAAFMPVIPNLRYIFIYKASY